MKEAFERVKLEAAELKEKCEKLRSFIHSPKYKEVAQPQQSLLMAQWHAMCAYLNILELRIENFEKAIKEHRESKS